MPAKSDQPIVCVISLGYVGLPLATEFPRHFKVIGFDTRWASRGLKGGNTVRLGE